jgi:hypothetical protein
LENLDKNADINEAWESVIQHKNISYELKQHKPWFDKECSKLLDKKMLAELQWL